MRALRTEETATARTVLLVEDNDGDADLIIERLAETGRRDRVLHAQTLSSAAARLQETDVDAVLLDLQLPDGFGIDCVKAIRRHARDVPIVVLTGMADEDRALACIAAGAQDYLAKHELMSSHLTRAIDYAIARVGEVLERRRADAAQERLAAIVESSPDMIVSGTMSGVITSWNRGAERILGLGSAEAIGRPVTEMLCPADEHGIGDGQVHRLGADWLFDADNTQEMIGLCNDGGMITLAVVACRLCGAMGEAVGFAAICRDVTESRRRDDELRRRHEELILRDRQMRALAERLTAVREEERTRMSREVHDELGQLLTGLKMDLRWIGRRLDGRAAGGPEAIKGKLSEAEDLVDRTVDTVQRIALELRPSALDALGLPAAVRDEMRRFAGRTGIHVDVEVDDACRPDPEIATALFRIVQELLTNIVRHAKASRVSVILKDAGPAWCLRVDDDGIGLRGDEEQRATSLGLLGMRERTEALGGSITLQGAGPGVTADVRVPKRRSGDSDA